MGPSRPFGRGRLEGVSNFEKAELEKVGVVGVQGPDPVLAQDRGQVGVGNQVAAHG